jgi:pimeloyl-ACP methyl ester carboxylesterase
MTTALPTIVLVHGAGAESASWNGVIRILQDRGYTTIAAANPLRSLSGDADYLASILATVEGPIVLVGHSYGGSVISNAVRDNDAVKALVFVAAIAPEKGESVADLANRFPGSTLGDNLHTVPLADGTTDLYILQDKYHQHFAADVAPAQAALDASTQRPFRDVALTESSGPEPAWKTVPSWFVFPELDSIVPLALHRFMAERAQAREAVEIAQASHAVAVSRPDAVADVILTAAKFIA